MTTEAPPTPAVSNRSRFGLVRDLTAEVEALYNYAKVLPRGTPIPHTKVEELTGIKYLSGNGISKNPWYQRVVEKWRKLMLIDPGIWPMAVKGAGYRLCTIPEQQIQVPDVLEKSVDRKNRKMRTIIASVHAKDMTDTEKAFAAERIGQATESLEVTRRHRVVRRTRLASPDTLPRPNGNTKT